MNIIIALACFVAIEPMLDRLSGLSSWGNVGPTDWFITVGTPLDWTIVLSPLDRRWTAGQNYVGIDVGPSAVRQ